MMIEEIRIFGGYMPAALFYAALALIVTLLSETVKQRRVSIPPAVCLVPGSDVAVRRSLPW